MAIAPNGNKPQAGDQVGYGPVFPLRFAGNDFECAGGFTLVASAVRIIAGAEGATRDGALAGEFPGMLRLGTQVSRVIHSNASNQKQPRWLDLAVARYYGMTGIIEFEPRVVLDPAQTEVFTVERQAKIKLHCALDPEVAGSEDVTRGEGIEANLP